MSALDTIKSALDAGEASASPFSTALFPPPVVPHSWLTGVDVLYITDDAKALTWIDRMVEYVEERAAEDTDTYLCVDTETCPQNHLLNEERRLTEKVQTTQAHFKTFPIPAKIKEPELRTARDEAKQALDDTRAEWEKFATLLKRAGLSHVDGQVRLLQVYRPIEWDGETVKTVFVFDRWALSKDVWEALGDVLAHPNVHWVGHHVLFDMMMLERAGVRPNPNAIPDDTMLQGHALVSDMTNSMSLDGRCQAVLKRALDKTQRRSDWSAKTLSKDQIDYAAADVVATWELFEAQNGLLASHSAEPEIQDAWSVYVLLRDALPAVQEMSLSGVGFDMDRFSELRKKIVTDYDEGREKVIAAFLKHSPSGAPEITNPGSSAQLNAWAAACFSDRTKRLWPRTDTGAFKFGQDELGYQIVTKNLPDELVPPIQALLDWASAKKTHETFSDYARWARKVGNEYRLFGKIRIGGAETGRFSIQDPALQTISRDSEFRQLFIPAPGRKFVVRDYGQIEVRVAAVLSGDEAMLYAINHGLDMHTMTALACFNTEPTVRAFLDGLIAAGKITEGMAYTEMVKVPEVLDFFKKGAGKLFRQIAKIATFGLLYGQGPNKLAWTLFAEARLLRPVDECREIQCRLLNNYPGLKAWMKRTRNAAESDGMVWTPCGRRYSAGTQWYTKAINTPCQGGAAEIMLRALSYFPGAWDSAAVRARSRLVLTVHDELLAEAAEDATEATGYLLDKYMVQAAVDLFPTMPTHLLVEGGVGDNWAHAKGGH
jgi:DNA polymerase I-like protein with 3'-5' exonuclease and polymerase domains